LDFTTIAFSKQYAKEGILSFQEEVTGDWLVYPFASVPFEFELRTKHLQNVKNALYQLSKQEVLVLYQALLWLRHRLELELP